MTPALSLLALVAVAAQFAAAPARAEMSDSEKVAAAIAILGVAALAHHKHHYDEGKAPRDGEETAEFERGYRDGLHGYPYWEDNRTPSYAQGYQAGDGERENSMAHRRQRADAQAPHMANKGCAEHVAAQFAVGIHQVHIVKARSPGKHEWEIETAVGREHMVCTMRDTGELIDLRVGRL